MAIPARPILFATALVALGANAAHGGMPSVTLADLPSAARALADTSLTELARQRLEVISFFLLGLLACAAVIRWVWNSLRKDFPILPRLSYPRALGVVVLWGLLFILVLTMISGARELMTPGAWEKKGLTYKLAPPPPVAAEISARTEALTRLFGPLSEYATAHEGRFPAPEQAGVVPDRFWIVPSPPGGRYRYVGGQTPKEDAGPGPKPLAYEPDSAGPDRLVLMTGGQVQWLPAAELDAERLPEAR